MSTEDAKKLILETLQKEDLRILMKENTTDDQTNLTTQYHNKNSRKFVCCVDGTESGDITFHTMTHLMRKRDYIAILHSPDEDGKGTTFEDSSGMKHHYEDQLMRRGLPSGNFLFQVEPKGNMNTLTILKRYMSLFNSHQKQKVTHSAPTTLDSAFIYEIPPDFILLGYDSWKGQNSSNTTPSTSDLVMRQFHVPCIICKKRFPDLNHQLTNNNPNAKHNTASIPPLTYIMAIDDTETSMNGLEILLQFLKSIDRLILVHVHYPRDSVPADYLTKLNNSQPTQSSSENYPILNSSTQGRQGGLSQLKPAGDETDEKERSSTDHATVTEPSGNRSSRIFAADSANPLTKYYPLTADKKEQYLEILREYGPRVDKNTDYDQMIVEISAASTDIQAVRARLVDYVNNISPDFFVIAPKNKRKLTSFTEFILTEINTSVILCKN